MNCVCWHIRNIGWKHLSIKSLSILCLERQKFDRNTRQTCFRAHAWFEECIINSNLNNHSIDILGNYFLEKIYVSQCTILKDVRKGDLLCIAIQNLPCIAIQIQLKIKSSQNINVLAHYITYSNESSCWYLSFPG